MRVVIGGLCLAVLLCATVARSAAPPVPGSRGFTPEQRAWWERARKQVDEYAIAGRFDESEKLVREQIALATRIGGSNHWRVRELRFDVEKWRQLSKLPESARAAEGRALEKVRQGNRLRKQGDDARAEKLYRESLAIRTKALGDDHPAVGESRNLIGLCLQHQGKYADALPLYEEALRINREALGEKHPDTGAGYTNVAVCRSGQGKHDSAMVLYRKALANCRNSLGEDHPNTAQGHQNIAFCLVALGKPADALPLYEKVLAILQKADNGDDLALAQAYGNLASCLDELRQSKQAQPLHEKALQIVLARLKEDHPLAALYYNNVGHCLNLQGRNGEALSLHRKALAIRVKVLDENHPDSAVSYNNVASTLENLGRTGEALPVYEKALSSSRKAHGNSHPLVAMCLNNMGTCLQRMGKHSQAIDAFRKALAIAESTLRDKHPYTQMCFNNLAAALVSIGRLDDAQPLFEKTLELRRQTRGNKHLDTAQSCSNLAGCLEQRGKFAEALLLHREALAIERAAVGENHPQTAHTYNHIARNLLAQGKPDEALPNYRQALASRRILLGDDHPDTAVSSTNLALCLLELKRPREAARLLQASLAGQEAARFHTAVSGFDRAQANFSGGQSPQVLLAVALAGLGQPANAFRHAELGLSRGLLDDLTAPTGDAAQAFELRGRLEKLGQTLAAFASRTELTEKERAQRAEVVAEHRAVSSRLARLSSEASAQQVVSLSRIQKSLPDDAALVVWMEVDVLGEFWGCVVRREGAPIWQRLQGSKRRGRLAKDELDLPRRLYQSLATPKSENAPRDRLVADLRKQRFEPLLPHLKARGDLPAVKRLFVVPVGPMAFVPVEILAPEYQVSYVPSGSFLARQAEKHRALQASSLLALGDPVFAEPPRKPADPPAKGVLLLSVQPKGGADRAGLKAGDVLLAIGEVKLASADDLPAGLKRLPAEVGFWRDGKEASTKVMATSLGATIDQRSASAAVRAWRKSNESLVQRGGGHKRLEGTRIEVEAIASLVKESTKLLGSDASEQKLDALKGKLKTYRILHFATHGEIDWLAPERSALILAEDKLPDALEQARQNKKVYDGRLTVSTIRTWDLDADLVVLSACETGLGKQTGGDGLLGFSQAFLSRGARSVVLSRWRVDDVATSLLMRRFYQNMLGKREGLKKPMGRAAALQEAKDWLRKLTLTEAEKAIESLPRGKLTDAPKIQAKSYEHPFYWAAFTLIGDPD